MPQDTERPNPSGTPTLEARSPAVEAIVGERKQQGLVAGPCIVGRRGDRWPHLLSVGSICSLWAASALCRSPTPVVSLLSRRTIKESFWWLNQTDVKLNGAASMPA